MVVKNVPQKNENRGDKNIRFLSSS